MRTAIFGVSFGPVSWRGTRSNATAEMSSIARVAARIDTKPAITSSPTSTTKTSQLPCVALPRQGPPEWRSPLWGATIRSHRGSTACQAYRVRPVRDLTVVSICVELAQAFHQSRNNRSIELLWAYGRVPEALAEALW